MSSAHPNDVFHIFTYSFFFSSRVVSIFHDHNYHKLVILYLGFFFTIYTYLLTNMWYVSSCDEERETRKRKKKNDVFERNEFLWCTLYAYWLHSLQSILSSGNKQPKKINTQNKNAKKTEFKKYSSARRTLYSVQEMYVNLAQEYLPAHTSRLSSSLCYAAITQYKL